ncbi:DUF2975 domain-containing protein [Lacticaseibacillus saniviri]|uniref:DUF2975 domain-containing protein n=1 Tax=Lacticaseibacillus saniviri JCM 17471 = DSM 24301 TaxID=1293598 RepID=A0A0R2MY86_9LACO|nr:DUF2975 domain-containing protein [Lacticaseibacillus saniviri]KRO18406.1 hypothetical protein IV56_GL001540 [Lacticaseibacillus saniviri JCM 17471 = DSM 24301]
MMKRAIAVIKGLVILMSGIILLFSVMLFPGVVRNSALIAEAAARSISPLYGVTNITFLVGLYGAVLVLMVAAYQFFRLLDLINQFNLASIQGIQRLGQIEWSMLIVTGLYMVGIMPFIFATGDLQDAPGLIVMGFVIGLMPLFVSLLGLIGRDYLRQSLKSVNE